MYLNRYLLSSSYRPGSVLAARMQPRRQVGSELAHLELALHKVKDMKCVITGMIRWQEGEVYVDGTACNGDS